MLLHWESNPGPWIDEPGTLPLDHEANSTILGIGSFLAGWFGVCVGVTSYSANIASIAITRVASRVVMQIAGLILIFFGIFTKVGAVLATIPDAMIGWILGMGMC